MFATATCYWAPPAWNCWSKVSNPYGSSCDTDILIGVQKGMTTANFGRLGGNLHKCLGVWINAGPIHSLQDRTRSPDVHCGLSLWRRRSRCVTLYTIPAHGLQTLQSVHFPNGLIHYESSSWQEGEFCFKTTAASQLTMSQNVQDLHF